MTSNKLGDVGVQLKTFGGYGIEAKNPLKASARKGFDQLETAIANGEVTEGVLDIMIPHGNMSGVNNFNIWVNEVLAEYPGINLSFNIGSFVE